MKKMKRLLSVLLVCVMLAAVLPMTVSAAGTQDDPINANDKWFGYGVDCYLLNPTIAEGNADGVWYTFTPEEAGILVLEHKYKDVDYDITVDWCGLPYTGGCVDGVIWNGPIMTLPVAVGDPITVHIATKDGAAGTVYANMKIVAGTSDDPIKVKSTNFTAYVDAGQTVYFQDDTLNANYATKGLLVDGSIDETVFYAVSVNSSSGAVTRTAFTDNDKDRTIEATLGGSLGSAGAPPVKPMWAIENNSTDGSIGTAYFLTVVDSAHECNWDDDTDADCNTCGAIREIVLPCEHEYDNPFDYDCNVCGSSRTAVGVELEGGSISEDVNGLAMLFNLPVEGMTMKGTTAVYDNATIAGYKLVGMGAVISNKGDDYYDIEDVDGVNVIHVPAVYLYDLTEDTATFAIRVIQIPEEGKDTLIRFRSYFIYEDEEGVQHTVYSTSSSAAYNWYL